MQAPAISSRASSSKTGHLVTTRPRRLVRRAAAAAPTAAATTPITALEHRLADGATVELLFQPASSSSPSTKPPVLLVHGSYHAAWCWRDTFMPYLSARGFDTYAVSLRGQGASARVPAPGIASKGVAGTLATHADDLADVVAAVAARAADASVPPPVVCSHSFSGLILQDMAASGRVVAAGAAGAATTSTPPRLSGAAYLGSVPPSGNKAMVGRFLKRDPWASAKLTYAFIAATFARDAKTCRECFLSADADDALVESVRARIEAQLSPLRLLDLGDMNRRVPLPAPGAGSAAATVPSLVLRGKQDGVVDEEAAAELEGWLKGSGGKTNNNKVRRVEIDRMAHDVMLDVRWEEAARELVAWLEEDVVGSV
jgi:pimeloyl-ACP methyl ester carboxylesterase